MKRWIQTYTYRNLRRACLFLFFSVLVSALPQATFSQSTPTVGPWSGQIQCRLDVEQPGYSRHEVQSWTLTGRELAPNGDARYYGAKWAYTGQGGLQKDQGSRTTSAQWEINVPPTEAPLALFVREERFLIRLAHSRKTVTNAVTGTRQDTFFTGDRLPPAPVSFTVEEWPLPWIETVPGANLSGTLTMQTAGLGGDLPGMGNPVPAVCTYQFTKADQAPIAQESGKPSRPKPGTAATGWSGNAKCQIDVKGESYTDQQIHTWTISNGIPKAGGVYNATWSVAGQGYRAAGGQVANFPAVFRATWTYKVTDTNAPIAFVTGASGEVKIVPNHGQLTAKGGASGSERATWVNGNPWCNWLCSAEAWEPVHVSFDVTEFQFPQIEDKSKSVRLSGPASLPVGTHTSASASIPASTHIAGSASMKISPPVNDAQFFLGGEIVTALPLQPPDATVTASCTWDFHLEGQPAMAASPPTANTSPAPTANTSPAPTADVTGVNVTRNEAPTGTPSTNTSNPGGMVTAPGKSSVAGAKPTKQLTAVSPPSSTPTSSPTSSPASLQPPASGKYLVTMTGLWCVKATQDDPLDRDGHGDEIYAAAFVRKYDRTTGQNLLSFNRQTLTYGDSNQSDRIQAGSQTALGGIRAMDSIPNNATADRRVAPQDNSYFPYKLWGGTLTDGSDALIISPSIWESDGKPNLFYQWNAKQNIVSSSIFLDTKVQDQITSRKFGPLTLRAAVGTSGDVTSGLNTSTDIVLALLGIPPINMLSSGADRPIGLVQSGPDQNALPNTAIVLTREIIETALSSSHPPIASAPVVIPTPKPGIMVITFADSGPRLGDTGASYVMALQVERCDGPLLQFCAD